MHSPMQVLKSLSFVLHEFGVNIIIIVCIMQKKVKVEQEMNLLEQQKKHGSKVTYGDSIQVYRYCILVYKTLIT